MKGNKTILLLITFMLMICMAVGCSSTDTQTEETTQPATQVIVNEEETTVEEPQEEEMVEVAEPEVEEPVEEEPAEETLANEIIMNSDPIADWVATLEEEDLKFIIYNDVEGYKQILNDGETYHMKKDDKIFLYHPEGGVNNSRVLTPEVFAGTGNELFIDFGYSLEILWQDKEVVTYGEEIIMSGDNQAPKSVTCTFYKPTE